MKYRQRKKALPRGAAKEVKKVTGLSAGLVSETLKGVATPSKNTRRIARGLARRMKGSPEPHIAFPEYFPEKAAA